MFSIEHLSVNFFGIRGNLVSGALKFFEAWSPASGGGSKNFASESARRRRTSVPANQLTRRSEKISENKPLTPISAYLP